MNDESVESFYYDIYEPVYQQKERIVQLAINNINLFDYIHNTLKSIITDPSVWRPLALNTDRNILSGIYVDIIINNAKLITPPTPFLVIGNTVHIKPEAAREPFLRQLLQQHFCSRKSSPTQRTDITPDHVLGKIQTDGMFQRLFLEKCLAVSRKMLRYGHNETTLPAILRQQPA